MAILPRKPQAGDRTLQSMYDAICNIIDYLPSLEVRGDNKTIRANAFGSGKTLEVIGRTSSATPSSGNAESVQEVILARIYSGNSKSGYNVYLYPNGKDKSYTGTGTLFLTELSVDSELPIGSWILAHSYLVTETGGSD